MGARLKCTECGKITVEVCPTCKTSPLCPSCRAQFDECEMCDETAGVEMDDETEDLFDGDDDDLGGDDDGR